MIFQTGQTKRKVNTKRTLAHHYYNFQLVFKHCLWTLRPYQQLLQCYFSLNIFSNVTSYDSYLVSSICNTFHTLIITQLTIYICKYIHREARIVLRPATGRNRTEMHKWRYHRPYGISPFITLWSYIVLGNEPSLLYQQHTEHHLHQQLPPIQNTQVWKERRRKEEEEKVKWRKTIITIISISIAIELWLKTTTTTLLQALLTVCSSLMWDTINIRQKSLGCTELQWLAPIYYRINCIYCLYGIYGYDTYNTPP